jgi:hypothetical protein
VSKDEDLAFKAALDSLHEEGGVESQELVDTIYACLSSYYAYFKANPLEFVSTETDMTVEVNEWLSYRCKADGIVDPESIAESKTSGEKPGAFWNKYDMDFQTTGNIWTVRKGMDLPIKYAYVSALFKPGYKNPVAKTERRKIEIEEYVIDEWMKDLLGIAREIRRAHEEKDFFKSWNCRASFGYCEYYDYCSNKDDVDILRGTHYLKVWDAKKPESVKAEIES